MSKIEQQDLINTSNISTKYGIIAGLVMAVVLFLFQLAGNDFSPFLKLSKYLVLAGFLVVVLNIFKDSTSKDIFIKGFPLGVKTSLVAALVLIVVNIILFAVAPSLAFSKYSLEPSSAGQLGMISGVLFFETLVFGSLITFIVLQYLKGKISQ